MRPKRSTQAVIPPSTAKGIPNLAASYRRHLKAENKAVNTITAYIGALDRFSEFLATSGRPLDVSRITKADVEGFMEEMLKTYAPASASNRFRALKTFFKWAVDEGEALSNPMERMKPPTIPEVHPLVLDEKAIKALLAHCAGKSFEDLRDLAIIRLFLSTGCRRAEIGGLSVDDVDLDGGLLSVVGKGSRPRSVPFDDETVRVLDRYIRRRKTHPRSGSTTLWLGHEGPMTDSGIYQVVRDRALAAGLGHVYCHQLRHTWAHRMLANGHQESNVMTIAGWKSQQMIRRYGASAATQRAQDAYRRKTPLEGL